MTPKTIPFWDEFVKRFGTAPVYTGIGTYDAVHVYADAVRRANSLDTDAVIKALEKTDIVGIAGKIQFDEVHDVKTGPGLQEFDFRPMAAKRGSGRGLAEGLANREDDLPALAR